MLPAVFSLARIISAQASRVAGLLRQLKTSSFPRKAFRISIALAMVGPVLFQAGSTAAQLLYPGHDFIQDAVSSLVFGSLRLAPDFVFLHLWYLTASAGCDSSPEG